ncbi:hypothetical protein QFC21_004901 [Naganishia friedmannii]|uniref:Uncharacterized protein n=1 Tax=Naganishia friedmannii TaxID=89922 RepID=A0ACC2VF83_9TREE|nr:hypothetical protein QFC21_004901 [Naganishia friedmannii]
MSLTPGPSVTHPTYRPSVQPQVAGIGMGVPPNTMPIANRGVPPPKPYYNTPSQPARSSVPMKGTLAPGERIKVGNDTVTIEKYLSEGGYAHVYLTHSDTPLGPNKLTTHCLKRLAFRQEQAPDMMKDVEKEIEVMKALRGNPWIVEYLGSEVRRTSGGAGKGPGWEVFILMEFCSGGGIIDLLNKRLRDRLKEQEILSIFVDIENILCHPTSPNNPPGSSSISSFRYKLCDFGSTTYPSSHAPRNKREADEQAFDLNRHTTLQYRAPEMVEPLLGLPVGLPADVWAMGVLLYKLCYYTTPFEEHGPLAIVNAKYTFPSFPVYSPKLQHVIASMLIDQPARRPTVFDILKQIHRMRGTQPSRNYQQVPTIVEPRRTDLPSRSARTVPSPSNSNLLDFTEPTRQTPSAVSPSNLLSTPIQPQRRGRPIRTFPAGAESASPSRDAPGSATSSAFRTQLSDTQKSVPAPTASSTSSLHSKSPQPQLVTDIKKFTADFSDAFTPEVTDKTLQSGSKQATGENFSASFGFDNSFDPSSSFSGPAQKLSPLRTSKSLQPGMGNGVDSSSAFEATISPPSPMQHEQLAGSKTANPASASVTGFAHRQDSASAHSPEESSFEDRYPTLERLHSDGSADLQLRTSPLLSPATSSDRPSPSSSIPLRGKSMQRSMPSYHQASLTGGTYGEGHTHTSDMQGGIPLPRSNQVTGTAFKMTDNTLEYAAIYSSDEVPERTGPLSVGAGDNLLPDYVDMPSPTQGPTRGDLVHPMKRDLPSPTQEHNQQEISAPAHPNDLLTGDNIDLLTGDDDLPLPFVSMQPSHRPLKSSTGNKAPPPLAAKPPSLSLNSSTAHPRPGFPRAPSSIYDAQWSPVDKAKADLVKSPLPQLLPASADPDVSDSRIPTVTSPIDLSASQDQEALASRQRYQQPNPTFQSSHNSKSSTYPLTNSRSLAVPSSACDTSDRRSSVNAVTSDLNAMALASGRPGPAHFSGRNPADGKKPPVASKPDQLKVAGHMSSSHSDGASIEGLGRSRSMYISGRPAGWTFNNNNSSSLEAGTDTIRRSAYLAPSNNSETSVPADDTEFTGKRNVNALIAQWSRAGPPVQGTPVSALRSKPTIGTGRRL